MDLHYLTFMGRNLENKKKSILVWTMKSDGMIVRICEYCWYFGDSVVMNDILSE